MEIIWPRIILGLVLIGIWSGVKFKVGKKGNPKNLNQLQGNLVQVIQNSAMQTALLTAGLLSLVLGF